MLSDLDFSFASPSHASLRASGQQKRPLLVLSEYRYTVVSAFGK